MDRGVQKVRQSIKHRKKNRARTKMSHKSVLPFTATEEEKHGFFDSQVYDVHSSFQKGKQKSLSRTFFAKAFLSVALFIAVVFLLKTNIPNLQQAQEWTYKAVQDEFPFAQVNEWYVTKLGSPLSFTPQGNIQLDEDDATMELPVMGHVVETFSTNGTGIMISPDEKTVVSALSRGVVLFAGNDQDTHKTVVIQHADGSNTTYGHLSAIDVHVYQIVNANETIGTFQPTEQNEMVYFSIEKDSQFIDPSQVIPVGDIP